MQTNPAHNGDWFLDKNVWNKIPHFASMSGKLACLSLGGNIISLVASKNHAVLSLQSNVEDMLPSLAWDHVCEGKCQELNLAIFQ